MDIRRTILPIALLFTAAASAEQDSGYLWTPEKDADGRIKPASVQALQRDHWYEVADTTLQPLLRKLKEATGKSYAQLNQGNERITSTFNAWVGGDLGDDGIFYLPWGGGHGASSLNAIWGLDIERMGGDATWNIIQPPSDPDKPGAEWSSAYKRSKNYTNYRPALAFPADVLPDGMPTSRHQYDGVWFDSKRKTINQSRGHLWSYDTRTGETTGKVWHVDGKDRYPGINGNLWYNPFHDTVVGRLHYKQYHYFDHIRYHPETHTTERHGSFAWAQSNGTCGTRYKDNILYLGYNAEKRTAMWAIYDLKAEKMNHGRFKGVGFNWENEMPVCVYVPAWDKVLRRMQSPGMRGKWLTFDLPTMSEGAYTPQGKAPPYDRYPGTKVFYYPPWKAVIYITTPKETANTVYVMRTG